MTHSQGRVALVTGGSRGIGRAIALTLSQAGTYVYISYLTNEAAAKDTVAAIHHAGGQAKSLQFDITDPEESQAAVKTILAEQSRIDFLINNAGIRQDRLLAMMKPGNWERVIQTNLSGFYYITRPVIKSMIKQKFGRVVNISSAAGQMGNAGQVNYSASKAGLIGATKALAREVAKANITVNAVAPGFVDTEMLKGMDDDQIEKMIPCGRLGTPEDVAYAVEFLCSENASYINGQVIGVNGGMV